MSGFHYFRQPCDTLSELFFQRAQDSSGIYLHYGEQSHSFQQVYQTAMIYGSLYRERGAEPGDRICLLFNNSPQFFYAFWGAVLMGAVPVPLAPTSDKERVTAVIRDCRAALVLVDPEIAEHFADQGHISGTTLENLAREKPLPPVASPHPASPDDLLFLQYTSGTTGDSKGVMLTHGAIMANLEALMERMQVDPRKDSFSILIPMFHDMGLIGFGIGSVYAGVKLVLFRQDIRNLYRWLESFQQHGVTISGCSNTILHLTVRAVLDPQKYDLANLRLMVVGSEPVLAETVNRFEQTYHKPGVTAPAYGLAEISLCATMATPMEGLRVDEEGYVSCGRPLAQVKLRVDGAESGEILIKTPSAMSGYFRRDDSPFDDRNYLRTGDLGRVDDQGYLYVCGRIKNIIIRDGKNFAPHELEEVATSVKPVRLACVFALPGEGREQIVLVAEVPKIIIKKTERLEALYQDIYQQAAAHCRYRPDRVIFTTPASIPHSLNGKMQHQKLREMIATGDFHARFETRSHPQSAHGGEDHQ